MCNNVYWGDQSNMSHVTWQKVRDWDNNKTGKGSKHQLKEMAADDRKWQKIQEMTTCHNTRYIQGKQGGEMVVGNWLLGTW